jgi:hypothetical protein
LQDGIERGSLVETGSILFLTPIWNFLKGGMHVLVKLNVILIHLAFLSICGCLQDLLYVLVVQAAPL